MPYLNKAFTIDDPFFLLEAQQVRKAPLQPTALSVCWVYDATCTPVAHTMFLMAYVLAPVVNSSAPEIFAHLIEIIVLWGGIVGTVSLAFRLGLDTFEAAAAGLLLAATPPVLAIASTAMPDVLAMSLGVIGIDRLIAWKAEGKFSHGVVSALALGLAPLARVHLVFLWPIGALLLRDDARIFDVRSWAALPRRRWIPLVGAVFVIVAVLAITRVSGNTPQPSAFCLSPYRVPHNLRSYCIDWVVAIPLGIPWLALRYRRMRFSVLLPILFVGMGLPMIWSVWSRSAMRSRRRCVPVWELWF